MPLQNPGQQTSKEKITWDLLQRIALGEMGMAPSEFWAMTLREFLNKLEGFREREKYKFRDNWIRTRRLACWMLQPWVENEIEDQDLGLFPWETGYKPPPKKAEKRKPTREYFEYLKEKWKD